MNKSPNDLETRLARLMERQSDKYLAARSVLGTFASETSLDAILQLQETFETVQKTQTEVDRARTDWKTLNSRPGPELRAAIDRQQQLLEQLLHEVEQVQTKAGQDRERLLPSLDKASLGQKMQLAYGRAVKAT